METARKATFDGIAEAANLRALFILYAIFCFFYATNLVSFHPVIDEEIAAFADMPRLWASQGRWTISLISLILMPTTTIPYPPLATFGLLGAIAYLICLRAMGFEHPTLSHYAAFPLFIAFPTWAFVAEFSLVVPGAGLGLLLIAVAALEFSRLLDAVREHKPLTAGVLTSAAVCIVSTAVAVGVYQAFLPAQLALYLGVTLMRYCREPIAARAFAAALLTMAALLLASLLLYAAVTLLVLDIFNLELSRLPTLLKVEDLASAPIRTLRRTLKYGLLVYSGSARLYGVPVHLIALPLLFGAVGLISAATRGSAQQRATIAVLALALLACPFAINPLTGGNIPIRVMIAVPVVVWMMAMLGIMFASSAVHRVAILLAPLVYFQTLQVSSQFNANRALARTHDQILAGSIYDRIARVVPDMTATKSYKIDFFGAKPFIAPFARGAGQPGG